MYPFFNDCISILSDEIAEVKSELEEEGFTSDEAVKLIQQVYRRVRTFNNNIVDSQGPVQIKVTEHLKLKTQVKLLSLSSF